MLIDSVAWLGHASFRIAVRGATIYVDPYRVSPGAPKADVILVTHGHYDHFSPQDVELLSDDSTWLIAPAAVAERATGRVASIAAGEAIELDHLHGIDVAAIAAYNTSKRDSDGNLFHPREAGWVGFEINVRGQRLYHSGDTDVIPEMDAVAGVDVALLPVSGTYVMTAAEAAEAARRIQPGVAVPMSWGSHLGSRADAEDFAARASVDVRILDRAP
jgi:L-ascorbate metabolism protein UlaG (beta-lactamase superfamily)